jgi:hypothetical protein
MDGVESNQASDRSNETQMTELTIKQKYNAIKAILAARAEARANIQCGDIVTIQNVGGEWRVTNMTENGNFWARKVDSPSCRIFKRSRCTPITAPALVVP